MWELLSYSTFLLAQLKQRSLHCHPMEHDGGSRTVQPNTHARGTIAATKVVAREAARVPSTAATILPNNQHGLTRRKCRPSCSNGDHPSASMSLSYARDPRLPFAPGQGEAGPIDQPQLMNPRYVATCEARSLEVIGSRSMQTDPPFH